MSIHVEVCDNAFPVHTVRVSGSIGTVVIYGADMRVRVVRVVGVVISGQYIYGWRYPDKVVVWGSRQSVDWTFEPSTLSCTCILLLASNASILTKFTID